MRIVIDILTPKQCMLFSKVSERLEERGHEILRTTRDYRELTQLLKLKGIEALVVGRHGGKTLIGKLKASVDRMLKLTQIINEFKPDVALSFSSPEMARVAYGLKIPHVCVNDSPHAEAVAKLTIPLSQKLLTPKIIPKKEWIKYGIPPNRIIQYKALDPWAWLKDFKPNPNILNQLELDPSELILTFRMEEAHAAYLLNRKHKISPIILIIRKLIDMGTKAQIVIIPRYEDQISLLKRTFKKENIKVCEKTVDGPSLLYYSSIFIGAGGTMSIEAALLGVPTISCYPAEPYIIERYLMNKGLIIRETSPDKAADRIWEMLINLDKVRNIHLNRARRLTMNFDDPTDAIMREVERME